jgi:hypothetical protein
MDVLTWVGVAAFEPWRRAAVDPPLPPRPWPAGELRFTLELGQVKLGE